MTKLHPDTAALLGAILKKLELNKTLTLTAEEIEDAPDVEMRENFEMDTVELRISTYGEKGNETKYRTNLIENRSYGF